MNAAYFKVEGVDAAVVIHVANQILQEAKQVGYTCRGPIPLPNRRRAFEKPVADVLSDVPEVLDGFVVRKQLVVVENPLDEFVLKIVTMPLPSTAKLEVGLKSTKRKKRARKPKASRRLED